MSLFSPKNELPFFHQFTLLGRKLPIMFVGTPFMIFKEISICQFSLRETETV